MVIEVTNAVYAFAGAKSRISASLDSRAALLQCSLPCQKRPFRLARILTRRNRTSRNAAFVLELRRRRQTDLMNPGGQNASQGYCCALQCNMIRTLLASRRWYPIWIWYLGGERTCSPSGSCYEQASINDAFGLFAFQKHALNRGAGTVQQGNVSALQ